MMDYSHPQLLSSSRSGLRGTALWMAPELFLAEGGSDVTSSKASDMWAYGMVIYVSLSFLMTPTCLTFWADTIGNHHKKATLSSFKHEKSSTGYDCNCGAKAAPRVSRGPDVCFLLIRSLISGLTMIYSTGILRKRIQAKTRLCI